jgi:hypothetical protein
MDRWRIVAVALAVLLTVPLLGVVTQKSHGYTPNGSEYQETLTQVSTIGAKPCMRCPYLGAFRRNLRHAGIFPLSLLEPLL